MSLDSAQQPPMKRQPVVDSWSSRAATVELLAAPADPGEAIQREIRPIVRPPEAAMDSRDT
jgi:hypothetical protein